MSEYFKIAGIDGMPTINGYSFNAWPVGYPITYLSDDHVSVTGDPMYIPGSEGITLDSGYDTYYRISGYDITGGSIIDGKLVPTGPCTIRAVEKVNYFTATGNFEQGSNVSVASTTDNAWKYTNVPAKYALHVVHTGDIPASWYETSSRWNPSNASAYTFSMNGKMKFTGSTDYSSDKSLVVTAICLVGDTASQSQTYSNAATGSVTWTYNKTLTSNTQNVNYGVSAKLGSYRFKNGRIIRTSTATYIATGTTGTWTATGIAP